MKRTLTSALSILLFISIVSGCYWTSSQKNKNDSPVSNSNEAPKDTPKLPYKEGFVNDFAGVVNDATEAELESKLSAFKRRAKIDIVVATVKTTGIQPISDYTLKAASDWEVGADNPDQAGMLIMIAIDDKKWQIQTSPALQRILSNDDLSRIGSLMNGPFLEGKYGQGITSCVDAFIKKITEQRRRQRS